MMDSMKEICKNDMDHANYSEVLKEYEVNNRGEKYFERLRDALSIRAQNVLSNNELYYYDDFILFISSDNNNFVNLRNCGKKTVKELEELVTLLLSYLKDPATILNTPITKLGFSVRTIISLKAVSIETLGELVSFNKDDILRFHGLGDKSIHEIKSVVCSKGLRLGMDINEFCQGITTSSIIRKHVANKEIQQYQSSIVSNLMLPIEDLGFSVRTINCLKAANIETLGELASFEKEVILKFRNLGKKSFLEIENVVIKKGLWFGFDIRTFSFDNDTKSQVILNDDPTNSNDIASEQNEIVDDSILNIPIEDLGFSFRAFNCLKTAGIDTLGELVAFTKEELLNFRNLGRKSIQEIEEVVVYKGLRLGMDMRKYCKEKSLKTQALEPFISNPTFRDLSRVDLDYIYAFKEKYSHFPMVFLLCKSLSFLTDREQKVVKMTWGLKSLSFKSPCKELPEFPSWSVAPAPTLPIEEIADEIDLTRERTRQIFEKANRRISRSSLKHIIQHEDWSIYGVNDNPFLFPSILDTNRIVEERDFLIEYAQKHWDTVGFYRFTDDLPCISENHLYFILFLRGMHPFWMNQDKKVLLTHYFTTKPATPDFFVNNRLKQYNYNRAVREVRRLQEAKKTESIFVPIISYFVDNENYWSGIKPTAIEKDNVLSLLIWIFQKLCEAQIENNSILFKANKADYGNIMYEILVNEGMRLSRDELFERLKKTCDKMGLRCNLSNSSQITRFLANDQRIITYGKSSYWGLKEWGESYGSIRELARHFVMKSKEPVQIDDLTKFIMGSRPDSNENSITAIIRQTTSAGELLLFFGDYIGWPNRKYEKEYIIMPQTFDDWSKAFKEFVLSKKRYPTAGLEYEGYLYRWYQRARQLTELTSEEILKIDALEKELAYYPHNMTEYNFLHKCNLYKKFVEGNNRMIEEADDSELYKWFNSASLNYSSYDDNRKDYFSQLLQYLSSILY